MPICALLEMGNHTFQCQWFSEAGKTRHEEEVPWSAVTKVEVFKRDMFTYDLICLTIQHEGGESIELDEEDMHWDHFVSRLPVHLNGALPWGGWFSDVAFPAFEKKAQTIYIKQS